MAQEQPRRAALPEQEPIRYGDVFAVSGKVADEPVAPRDAAAMQSAESQMMGNTQKGGPAAVMQSAAMKNVEAGVVAAGSATDIPKNQGVRVSMAEVQGNQIVTEAVGDQVLLNLSYPTYKLRKQVIVESDSRTVVPLLHKGVTVTIPFLAWYNSVGAY